MDAIRAQLDELMGKDRNLLPNEKSNAPTHFSDPQICPYFLCGFCPSELFVNTKSDLGPCKKDHDEFLREQFKKAPVREKEPIELEFLKHLERVVADIDRRIRKNHERLGKADASVDAEVSQRLDQITERTVELIKKAEDLGAEGRIEDSERLLGEVAQLQKEKELLTRQDLRPTASGGMEKRMELCDICGAFLVVGDTEKRISSHLDGKQHIGYARIRDTIALFKRRLRIPASSGPGRRESSAGRDSDRSRDRPRSYHSGRDRSSSSHRYSASSSSSHERSAYHDLDRDLDRDRERDRERHRSRSPRR